MGDPRAAYFAEAALHTTGLMVALKMSNRKLVKGKNAKKLIKAEKEVSKETDSKLREILDPFVADFRASL